MTNYFQISMRELLLIVLFAAAGLAGLMTGGVAASIVMCISMVVTIGFAIVAFVGRDRQRSLAIGFLVPVIAYAAIVLTLGSSELDPYEGKLPTTKLIKPVFRWIVRPTYVNYMTGEPVPDYDPKTDPNPMMGSGGGGFGGGGSYIGLMEKPDRAPFMALAHILVAMICGYAGSKFAVWVQRRQSQTGTRDAER